jgi:hypothetical protein
MSSHLERRQEAVTPIRLCSGPPEGRCRSTGCADMLSRDSLITLTSLHMPELSRNYTCQIFSTAKFCKFRGNSTRTVSIDRIFGKIRRNAVSQGDKKKLKGLPRRSLISDIGFSFVGEQSESDHDETEDSTHDDFDPDHVKEILMNHLHRSCKPRFIIPALLHLPPDGSTALQIFRIH